MELRMIFQDYNFLWKMLPQSKHNTLKKYKLTKLNNQINKRNKILYYKEIKTN